MKSLANALKSGKTVLLICCALAAMVWAVFGQTLRHEFVNFDDNLYVYENPDVALGLSRDGAARAFTKRYVGIWLPITMLSYQLDHELSGLNPGAFHRTNVLIHTFSVLTLFLVLRSLTGSLWQSAFAAALFAIHPLRAESVAWISERKDVLSGLFFMLTLGAYTRWVRHPSAGRCLLTLLLFIAGLMSKPMLVTLPCVMLLLDFWPLNRFESDGIKKLIVQKVPFLLISAAFAALSVWTQRDTASVEGDVTLLWRIGNAAVSSIVYIKQMIIPAGLAAFYPHPGTTLPLWQISASLALLTLISTTLLLQWKKMPWLLTGWLWYLGMLVPVSGIKQVGIHAHADRYTYLPQIGLYILLSWGIAELCKNWRHRRLILGTGALLVLAGLGAQAWIQTSCWRNGEALWAHTLSLTDDNKIANYNLARSLEKNGKTEEAVRQYKRELQAWPQDTGALINLGCILAANNQPETARDLFQRALEIKPDSPEAHTDLGIVLAKQEDLEAAITHYHLALQINPDYLEAHINLGLAAARQENVAGAIEHLQTALKINPNSASAHYNLGIILASQGRTGEALPHFQKAWKTNPDNEIGQKSLSRMNQIIRTDLN
jgi:tetratricopeptide (TPR) repeat protein